MTEEQRSILEWLIENIDLSDKSKLFGIEHEKDLTPNQNSMDIYELEKIDYKGRKLIRRVVATVYFYPLAIQNYLKE